jgi:hypothetical protein
MTCAIGALAATSIVTGVAAHVIESEPPSSSESADFSSLSFDLRGEYETGFAEFAAEGIPSKTLWNDHGGLERRLLSVRANEADRRILVEMMIARGAGDDMGDGLLNRLHVPLMYALVYRGERVGLVRLLAGRVPWSGMQGPLSAELHDLRLEGLLPDGLGVLFEAYDLATPAGREQIQSVLAGDFRYFINEKLVTESEIVPWVRTWYEANKDMLMDDTSLFISGGRSPDERPVLRTIRAYLDEVCEQCACPQFERQCYVPYEFVTYSSPFAPVCPRDPMFIAEEERWAAEFEAKKPRRFSIRVVDPHAGSGRANLLMAPEVVCDFEVTWCSGPVGESVDRTARITRRFMPAEISMLNTGEPRLAIDVPHADAVTAPIVVQVATERWSVGSRIAGLIAGDLWLAALLATPPRTVIKIYDTPSALQFSVGLSASPELDAWSWLGEHGLSVKIVADEQTSLAEMRQQLERAVTVNGE